MSWVVAGELARNPIEQAHRVREMNREHGGVICSECGWHLGGRFLDTEKQIRDHEEYVQGLIVRARLGAVETGDKQ